LEAMISSVEADIKDIYRIVARAQKEVYQKIRDKCGLSEMSIKVRRENAKVQEKNSVKKQQYEQAKLLEKLKKEKEKQRLEALQTMQLQAQLTTSTNVTSSSAPSTPAAAPTTSSNWDALGSTRKWETKVPKEWENKIKPFWDNNNAAPSTPPKLKLSGTPNLSPRKGLNVGATSYPLIMTPQPQSPTHAAMPLQMLYPVNQLPQMAYIGGVNDQLNAQLMQQRFMLQGQQQAASNQQRAQQQTAADILQKQQLMRYFGGQLN